MFLLKKFLSAWLLPPLGLLILALAALMLRGHRRSGVIAASVAVAMTFSLSLPIVADPIARSLEEQPISATALANAQAIVILGGGINYGAPEYGGDTLSRHSLERVRYGAKLARESHLPILVSGGSVYGGEPEAKLMKQILETEFKVPVRWLEDKSRDTAQNAAFSAAMLNAAGIDRIALVTHAGHMQRSVAAFKKYGLEVMPAPMGFAPRGMSLFQRVLPTTSALERSTNAIHEWVGRMLPY